MLKKIGDKSAQQKKVEVDAISVSEDSINYLSRIGVSSNYIGLSALANDEVVLDFYKVSVVDSKKTYKDLVSRVTLSRANALALKDLLDRNLK